MRRKISMDDFNNFFDDQRQQTPERAPIYHAPEPKRNGPNKSAVITAVCITVAVLMCIVVVVNVVVLASMKDKIARDYAASMAAEMRAQYEQAISDSLADTDIVSDVTENATKEAINAIKNSVGEVANSLAGSVARLYMYESASANPSTASPAGLATAFLITDYDGTEGRYLLTNAHCVRHVVATATGGIGGGFWGGSTRYTYKWASYGTIICVFEGDDSYYRTEIIAYGSYNDDNLSAENDQADLAILRIVGTQPSNEKHPSLKLASSDTAINRGTPIALIGNPEGVGETNTITSGTVSQVGIRIASWGSGTFIMTDAAVNSGNSGGPMLNSRGIVLGVVESKLASEDIDNMGFALSASTVRSFIDCAQLAANNKTGKNIT
ncbi:MAG: trypsin-like serine protease, partial [Clostridiales bacterium]|nr:trypsin-like serine protease [Clostridiales bacterium]